MADDAEVEIRVKANTGDAEKGAEQVDEAIDSIKATVQGLVDAFLILGGAATGSFRLIRAGAVEAGSQVKDTAVAVKELRESIAAFGEAVVAAFAIEKVSEFARKMGETSEQSLHTAQTFGLTVGEVQRMNAAAALAGVSSDTLTSAMMRLDKSFATAKAGGTQQSAAFKQIGIDLQGAYTQTQLLNGALEGLSHMDAGPAKVAAAMAIFGRNIQGLGPLLNMTSDQIAENQKLIESYGAVNEEAAAKGIALAESFNQNKVAMMGLNNVLTDALAPAFQSVVNSTNQMIKAFVDSYNQGGQAKSFLEGLAVTVKVVADAFVWFGAIVVDTFQTINGAIDFFQAVFDPFVDAVMGRNVAGADSFKTLGDVARDALTLNWSSIEGDIKSGLARIETDVVTTAKKMGQDGAAAYGEGVKAWALGDSAMAAAAAFHKTLWAPPNKADLPKTGTGTTGDDASKAAKDKAATEMQIWEDALQKQKLDANDFWNENLQGEVDFWNDKLSIVEAHGKLATETTRQHEEEILQIRTKIFEASKSLANQERTEQLANLQGEVKAEQDAETAKLKATMNGLQSRAAAIQQQGKDGGISPQVELQQLLTVNAQEVAAQQDAADSMYAIQMIGLRNKELLYANDNANLEKTFKDEEVAAAAHEAQLTGIASAGDKQRETLMRNYLQQVEQKWRGIVSPIVSAWGEGIQGMIEGTETFGQAMARIGESILGVFIKIGEEIVENWIIKMIMNKVASQTSAMGQIGSNAAVAGSAAYASTAAIPFVGPALAPAAAWTAYGGALAFEGLAFAESGFDVPTGVNPLTQLHQEEMVLPRNIANPLRDALSHNDNQVGSGDGSGLGGGGDGHLHLHGNLIDGNSVGRWFEQNKGHVLNATNSAVRAGGKIKTE